MTDNITIRYDRDNGWEVGRDFGDYFLVYRNGFRTREKAEVAWWEIINQLKLAAAHSENKSG
jgi:hypothetical protein